MAEWDPTRFPHETGLLQGGAVGRAGAGPLTSRRVLSRTCGRPPRWSGVCQGSTPTLLPVRSVCQGYVRRKGSAARRSRKSTCYLEEIVPNQVFWEHLGVEVCHGGEHWGPFRVAGDLPRDLGTVWLCGEADTQGWLCRGGLCLSGKLPCDAAMGPPHR